MGEGAYVGGEGCLVDVEDARTIGLAIWRVRDARGKSLRVVAGLAGMSKDTLNRIERGLLSPTLSQILALAEVCQCPKWPARISALLCTGFRRLLLD
jgi:transcriptional regulator with XRE-family HTH domain